MHSPRNTHSSFRSTGGFAVIIVLAFVVLLTGLIVAFFSRSILARQSSNAVVSQTRVDLFACGAVDQIIGDLKQEIADGSTVLTTSGTLYVPKSPANMLPQLVGSSGTNGLENLLKISLSGSAFYSGANYNTAGALRAAAISTSGTSLNGRYITPARWNAGYMMPVASASSATPSLTSGTFPMPDWILVDRYGNTPAPSTYTSALGWSASGSSAIVGRYAYAIYHEGGMLDINAAGFPSNNLTGAIGSISLTPYYKNSLAFADLEQLTGTSTSALLSGSDIGQIVGWRNYASASGTGVSLAPALSGTLPGLGWDAVSGSNYFTYIISNTTGFLTASRNSLVNNGGAFGSDQMFTSRQDLIGFFQRVLNANATTAAQVNHLNALNYLGTFTRDLNQPSYVKPQGTNSSGIGYYSFAPVIQSIANGGNDQATLDDKVNPAFLGVRVRTAFTRNDGTSAKEGDPLVKRRFALKRLAWLTYMGPSAKRNTSAPSSSSSNSDYDIWQLENVYGIPQSFLDQGTADNIKAYFGLEWQADTPSSPNSLGKWVYDVHCGPSGSGSAGAIMTLGIDGDTGGLAYKTAREPDFFELLKAAINAGSKAKAATYNSSDEAAAWQADYDNTFDYAVMQIGANIIAQSKVDGYGVRIRYNNGSTAKEFFGVENYPYFYRARFGTLRIRSEYPSYTANGRIVFNSAGSSGTGGVVSGGTGTLTDSGVSMIMLLPEIWNPHDQSVPIPSLMPSAFRIVADSTQPDNIDSSASGYWTFTPSGLDSRSSAGYNAEHGSNTIPGFPVFSHTRGGNTTINGGYKGYAITLTSTNTAMQFTLSGTVNFREPTLLARYNIPSGSNLHIDSSQWGGAPTDDWKKICISSGNLSFTANQGFIADCVNPLNLPDTSLVDSSTKYVGIPIGLFPCEWAFKSSGINQIARSDLAIADYNGNIRCTLRMQYQDPATSNWITYDSKYIKFGTNFWFHNILGQSGTGGLMQWGITWSTFTDPRTSRFGSIYPNTSGYSSNAAASLAAPGSAAYVSHGQVGYDYATAEKGPANPKEWIDPANDVLISNRPTADAGYAFSKASNSALSSQAAGWNSKGMVLGMLSQNLISVQGNGKRYSGNFGTGANSYGATTSGDYYQDPDNVVRRAMGGFNSTTTTTTGFPMASTQNPGPTAIASQNQSRPWILHRPFRSIAELGYVFSGTPWKNLDFFAPESGDSPLLDMFCIDDASNSDALMAGRVNLNTRQSQVLKSVLAGAYTDEQAPSTGSLSTEAANAASKLVARTSGTMLTNISELVGKWVGTANTAPIDGTISYDGFSNDLTSVLGSNASELKIQRFREASIRSLAASGQTRVWNLLIDVIAQVGRYPQGASGNLNRFFVEGEQHYWVHVAIDRLTGAVLDKKVEVVKE